ncbi:hypothetical protein [Pseudonocardia sp. TRM90224]|uniref:hypothetical protein n=1 Tax=Pseudonocardia sp. TRM90224 TaxID=2812678 RepID=UPI001E4D4911|nr:hypothetical protein [Pseudonocardia sp. TRM90224]
MKITGGSADACAIADLGTGHVVRILTERGVPYLPTADGEANSLRRQQACSLLDDQSLRRVPALDPTRRLEGFAGWTCAWGRDSYPDGYQPPTVVLDFEWITPLTAREGERQMLGGRTVFLGPGEESNGLASCHVFVVFRDRPLSSGNPAQEIVRIWVHADLPAAEQCRLAQDFASTVISKLPPP